jgi:phosphoglycerate dehydrogenase-like enzyme
LTILVLSQLAGELAPILRDRLPARLPAGGPRAGEPVHLSVAMRPRDLPDDLADVEVLLTFHPPRGLVERMPRLRWIASSGAGVDRILAVEPSPHITVTRMVGVFGRPLAEYVLAAVLAHSQRLYYAHEIQKRKQFLTYYPDLIHGKTAGVIGVGAIGSEIASLLRVAGLRTLGLRRSGAPHPAFEQVFSPAELRTFLGRLDILVLVVPLTPETRGMIGARELEAMQSHALLINVARGAIVVEPELVAALRAGTIAAAVLDVFSVEPLPTTSALWDLSNAHITPHVAGLSRVPDIAVQFADNFQRYVAGEELKNCVNRERGY